MKYRSKVEGRRSKIFCVIVVVSHLLSAGAVSAAVDPSKQADKSAATGGKPSSGDLIVKAWGAHGVKDAEHYRLTLQYTQQLIDLYKEEAVKQQASLKGFPKNRPDIESVSALNDVGTAHFIQGECYRDQGKNAEAIKAFWVVLNEYCFAQAWDPRGWFWRVGLASKLSIEKLNPKEDFSSCVCCPSLPLPPDVCRDVSRIPTKIRIADSGSEETVNYEKYGEFRNAGAKDYKYIVKDQEGLMAAVGEGIYPNTTSVRNDPEYKKAMKEGRLKVGHWCYLRSPDEQAAFFKWATAPEPEGVKLFYTALLLEKAGLITHAVKCYYAIVVHFPGQYGWTYWHTPWYVGQAAIAKIQHILKRHPELGVKLAGADVKIINGYDNDVSNDAVIADPGKIVKASPEDFAPPKMPQELPAVKQRIGGGKVHLVQYETGDWQLMADGKPYVIRGITYSPTKIGQSPDEHTQTNWMEDDFNKNGKADGPYDAFVDKNRNNLQDPDEPDVGDFFLMKEMGINTIRLYHHPYPVKKEILRDLFRTCGIRVIMGDFLGKYALGSGAEWNPGTKYNNEQQRKKMIESVTAMVREHKDEPYVLFWLLGNENIYGYACDADKDPDTFFKFANDVAKIIKTIDPDHPVAICSGDILYLDKFGKDAPDIDMFGTNAYRGEYGFGRLWKSIKEEVDRPAFITEFGCPAYYEGRSVEEAEPPQADYHRGAWDDIAGNAAFNRGAGNCIGGVVFEWLDEWWKAYEPSIHDKKGLWAGPFPDGEMHEEWLGVCGQGDGKLSPFLRQLRKSYYMYRKLWMSS